MIQCPKCGVPNAPGSQFCSRCGNNFTVVQQQIIPKNKSNLKILLIVFGCLIGSCVLCGLIGGFKEVFSPTPKADIANQSATNPSAKSPPQPASTPKAGSTTNPKDVISSIKWSDLDRIYNLKSNSTDMQKEALWDNYKGKRVAWSGTVTEVSKGSFG